MSKRTKDEWAEIDDEYHLKRHCREYALVVMCKDDSTEQAEKVLNLLSHLEKIIDGNTEWEALVIDTYGKTISDKVIQMYVTTSSAVI